MQIPVINQTTWRLYQAINVNMLVLITLIPIALVILQLGNSNEVEWTKRFLGPAIGLALLVLLALFFILAFTKKEVVEPSPGTPVKLILNLGPADYEKKMLAQAAFGGHYLEFQENGRLVTREVSSRELPDLVGLAATHEWTLETKPTKTGFLKKPPKQFLKTAANLLMLAS